jgi:hypothetical protein
MLHFSCCNNPAKGHSATTMHRQHIRAAAPNTMPRPRTVVSSSCSARHHHGTKQACLCMLPKRYKTCPVCTCVLGSSGQLMLLCACLLTQQLLQLQMRSSSSSSRSSNISTAGLAAAQCCDNSRQFDTWRQRAHARRLIVER